MRQIISWILGLMLGATVGALLVALLVPASRHEINARLKAHYQESLEAGRRASEQRRRELEAELARIQGRAPEQPPALPANKKRRLF